MLLESKLCEQKLKVSNQKRELKLKYMMEGKYTTLMKLIYELLNQFFSHMNHNLGLDKYAFMIFNIFLLSFKYHNL